MSRTPTSDEKGKITKLINDNASMFRNACIIHEYFYVITDTTDMVPGYGSSQYIAVLPTDNPDSIEWVNPSGYHRDDWHWGHSTVILTNEDFTKVYKVRGSNSAEDEPGNRKYSCNRKTNRKKEPRAERRADEARQREWQAVDKIRRKTDGAEREIAKRVQSRIAGESVRQSYTTEPVVKSRSARIEELFNGDVTKPSETIRSVIDKVNLVVAIGTLTSFILGASFGLPVTILSLAVTTFVAIGTGVFLDKRVKTVWSPDEYDWLPDKLLDALENDKTHDGAIERMDDIKLIVESGASDEKKNSSIERVLASIKTDEAPEKDTTAGDFLVDKIADMWDK